MIIKKFEDLKTSVVSYYIFLNGSINIDNLFPLLPITMINIENKGKLKKCKLPAFGIKGNILSVQYKGEVRGIIKKKETGNKHFKNCLTTDYINNTGKRVNAKIFYRKSQLCGVKSKTQCIDSINILLDIIKDIQSIFFNIRNSEDKSFRTFEWLKQNVKSTYVLIDLKQTGNILEKSYIKEIDLETFNNLPEYIDAKLLKYLYSFIYEYEFYEDYCKHLEWIFNISNIDIDNLYMPDKKEGIDVEETVIEESMINKIYDIGSAINRIKLREEINKYECYDAQFYNYGDNYVKIRLPFEFMNGESAKGKPFKDYKCNKFICYRTGKVTQSGPNTKVMKLAYENFIGIIKDIYIKIIKIDPLIHNMLLLSDENYVELINKLRDKKYYNKILCEIASKDKKKDKEIEVFPYSIYGINLP